MGQGVMTPLGIEEVDLEFRGKIPEQTQTGVVKPHPFRREIVGTDDRGVATGIAAPDITFLQYGNIADAVVPGQIVGAGEAVTPGTDAGACRLFISFLYL